MVFVGEQKPLVDKLLEYKINFLEQANEQLRNQIFNETKYGLRFSLFIIDNIKNTKKNLGYMLRQQYRHSDMVYDLLKHPIGIRHDESTEYCFKFLNRLQNLNSIECECFLKYYQDVRNDLILPVLKKYCYYSPSMLWVIFVNLLLYIGEIYVHDSYKLVAKHFKRDNYPTQHYTIIKEWFETVPANQKPSYLDIEFETKAFDIEQQTWLRTSTFA
jgi:hypothetical protein